MIWRLVAQRIPRTRAEKRTLAMEITLEVIAVAVAIFVGWPAIDRSPPWTRLYGYIPPTAAGGEFSVHWHTTPLLGDGCPGQLQIEVQSGNVIWPVLRRSVSSSLVQGQTDYITPPWPLPLTVPPGKAIYRVTSFWYCNWFQEVMNWPIIQVGPDIEFEVLPVKLPIGVPGPAGPAGPQGQQGQQGQQGRQGENR